MWPSPVTQAKRAFRAKEFSLPSVSSWPKPGSHSPRDGKIQTPTKSAATEDKLMDVASQVEARGSKTGLSKSHWATCTPSVLNPNSAEKVLMPASQTLLYKLKTILPRAMLKTLYRSSLAPNTSHDLVQLRVSHFASTLEVARWMVKVTSTHMEWCTILESLVQFKCATHQIL